MTLEPEQEEVLLTLVEAARNVPKEQREPFLALHLYEGPNLTIKHKGLSDGLQLVYSGDFDVLEREQFIAVTVISPGGAYHFDVLPRGFAYYRELKQRERETLQSVESNLRHYLDADRFSKRYPSAYQRLRDAENLLWDSDSNRQLTTIGHICREAMQEFATSLVEQHRPRDVDNDKAHTVSRVRAVINLHDKKLGEAVRDHVNALIVFWGTVSDLIQRQEHGGQKEGEPLIWEDGRRAVFQTAVVMYEIDSSLAKLS